MCLRDHAALGSNGKSKSIPASAVPVTGCHRSQYECALGKHAGSAGALLGPTLTALRALLDGPAAARHRDVLLELLLTLPTRSAT